MTFRLGGYSPKINIMCNKNNLEIEKNNPKFQEEDSSYLVFEIISFTLLPLGAVAGFAQIWWDLPLFGSQFDILSLAISLLPLIFTIFSLLMGAPSDLIAGLKRPTFLGLVPKDWPVGMRLLPFFVFFYGLTIVTYSLSTIIPDFYNIFFYQILGSIACLVYLVFAAKYNFDLLLKSKKTIFRILATHIREIVDKTLPISSKLTDVETAVENMMETAGIGETYDVLLEKLRQMNKDPKSKPELTLLLSLLRIEVRTAKINIEKINSNSSSNDEVLAFTTASINNVKTLLKDSKRFPLGQMLDSEPLVPVFVLRLAKLVTLLHQLGTALKLKKETKELAEAVYLAGCEETVSNRSSFQKHKEIVLAIEFHLFVDGLQDSGELDPWYWEFVRSCYSSPSVAWGDNPTWIFLAMFLFYAKDDKNLPEESQRSINEFLEEKIRGPISGIVDFTELTEYPILSFIGSQDRCVGLLKIIYEAFESLGAFQTFLYLPDNVVGVTDYPYLNCETAIACWMEILAAVHISDKGKLISGIEEVISEGSDERKKAFFRALARTFDIQGKEISDHPFNRFLGWSISADVESYELRCEVVKEIFDKFEKKPSSVESTPEDIVIKTCSAKISNVAARLVDEVKKPFQAVLTDNGALDHPHHEFKFENVLSAEVFMKEDFEPRLFESISGGAVQYVSHETSKKYDRLFEGKLKSIDEIHLELTHLGKDAYHFCTALGRREGFDKVVKDAIPSITEISDLDIFAPNKDCVERAILFDKGEIQATIWVNEKSTIVRRPDSGEILTYLKNRYPYNNGRFSLPSVYDESAIVWVTEEDAVERWRQKLIVYRIVIDFAVTIDDKKCYFIEMPYKLK